MVPATDVKGLCPSQFLILRGEEVSREGGWEEGSETPRIWDGEGWGILLGFGCLF